MLLINKTICGLLLAATFTMTACGGGEELQKVQGVAPTTIGVTGFGEFDPVAENADDAGRARNRRTEIVLVPNLEGVLPALDGKTVSMNQ